MIVYSVSQIKYDENGKSFFFIEKDGCSPIKAFASLNSEQLMDLYNSIQACQQNGEMPEVDLHVTVKYTSRGIRDAFVVGIGPKRESSKNLFGLFQ